MDEEGRALSAGSGESWEASEQGSDMVRHRLEKGPSGLQERSSEVPPSPSPRHLKPGVHSTPGPWPPSGWSTPSNVPAPSARPRLHSSPSSTPHSKVHSSTLQEVRLLQAGPQGQEPNLACPQAQGRPVPRPSCCALFPQHRTLSPRLQAPPSNGLTQGHSLQKEGP